MVSTTLKKCHKNSKWGLGTPIKVFSGELNEEVQLFFFFIQTMGTDFLSTNIIKYLMLLDIK